MVDDDAAHFRKSPSDETDAGRNPLAEHLPRFSPMREEALALKPKRKSATWKRRANDSKPRGESQRVHALSRIRVVTFSGRPRPCARDAKNRPLIRADGTSPPISFRERFTEHYTILNLDDESRNDQRNAVIVQDGCSCWLQSYPEKKQRRARSSVLLEEILAFIPKAREVPHTHN